jgi:hypothetical protein
VTILACEFAGLRLADLAHQGFRKRFGIAGVTGHANLVADKDRVNRD